MVVVLVLFIAIKLFVIYSQEQNRWWDEAVYLTSAKFLSSNGASGMHEPARPLLLPLLLAAGGASLGWGEIIELAFAAGVLYFTYAIARKVVNDTLALWSMITVAVTPSFFLMSGKIMTELPSLFFVLAGVLALMNGRMLLSGLLMAGSFLTRYFSLFIVLSVMFFWCIENKKDAELKKKMLKWSVGFGVQIALLLIIFSIAYSSPLYPFQLQVWLTKNTGWGYNQDSRYYAVNAIKDNFLYAFGLIGAGAVLSRKKHYALLGGIGYFFIMQFSPHKEMRFLLLMLPYMVILAAFFVQIFGRQRVLWTALLALLFVLSLPQIWYPQPIDYANQGAKAFQDLQPTNPLWISNPVYGVGKNNQLIPLYYPTYNVAQFQAIEQLQKPGSLVLSACDVQCPPNEPQCENGKESFFKSVEAQFKKVKSLNVQGCEVGVYEPIS